MAVCYRCFRDDLFQFLIGRLRTLAIHKLKKEFNLFQFLIGRLRTPTSPAYTGN